jgi:hypothetical protein
MRKFRSVLIIIIIVMIMIIPVNGQSSLNLLFNSVNIAINGKMIIESGGTITLPNGNKVPSSIVLEGTTYVPLRVVSENLGMEVQWEGFSRSVLIGGGMEVGTRLNPYISSTTGFPIDLHINDINPSHQIIVNLKSTIRGDLANELMVLEHKDNKISDVGQEWIIYTFEVIYLGRGQGFSTSLFVGAQIFNKTYFRDRYDNELKIYSEGKLGSIFQDRTIFQELKNSWMNSSNYRYEFVVPFLIDKTTEDVLLRLPTLKGTSYEYLLIR